MPKHAATAANIFHRYASFPYSDMVEVHKAAGFTDPAAANDSQPGQYAVAAHSISFADAEKALADSPEGEVIALHARIIHDVTHRGIVGVAPFSEADAAAAIQAVVASAPTTPDGLEGWTREADRISRTAAAMRLMYRKQYARLEMQPC